MLWIRLIAVEENFQVFKAAMRCFEGGGIGKYGVVWTRTWYWHTWAVNCKLYRRTTYGMDTYTYIYRVQRPSHVVIAVSTDSDPPNIQILADQCTKTYCYTSPHLRLPAVLAASFYFQHDWIQKCSTPINLIIPNVILPYLSTIPVCILVRTCPYRDTYPYLWVMKLHQIHYIIKKKFQSYQLQLINCYTHRWLVTSFLLSWNRFPTTHEHLSWRFSCWQLLSLFRPPYHENLWDRFIS